MRSIMISIAIFLCLLIQALPAQSEEQQSGTQLRFENVDEIRNRPSDIHVGSDPEYRPGMEGEYKGSDEAGYQKGAVEKDTEYYEEKTYYRRADDKEKRSSPAKRWE